VPLVAAAVCPHPPLLVPEVAAGAASELDALRSACATAVAGLASADRVVVVGTAPEAARFEAPVGGSLAPWGLPLTIGDAREDAPGNLPLSLLIGRWLAPAAQEYVAVAADASTDECAKLGADLVARDRVGLLIMGDGSARRTEKAPGYLDERALQFDAKVARALETADREALLAINPDLAAELMVAGRAAWQVLAGAPGTEAAALLYHDAPYGVGYLVASWR
jgi:aromatic ring-opening dioxygenase LigB subunit